MPFTQAPPATGNKETITTAETFNLTNEDELIEALKHAAVIFIGPDGAHLAAHDDLPPDMRECIRISRAVGRIPTVGGLLDMRTPEAQAAMEAYTTHRAECPDCIEADADSMLMDAESWREEGNEATAAELEAEATELRLRAAEIRAARATR